MVHYLAKFDRLSLLPDEIYCLFVALCIKIHYLGKVLVQKFQKNKDTVGIDY